MRVKDARMVHRLVKKTSQELAGAFYDYRARKDNVFFKRWPSEKQFVLANWKNFIISARQTLATMLERPYPEQMKVEIYEALVADGSLPYSVQETQVVNVPH